MNTKVKPNGKPSSNEALGARIAEVLCDKLRGSELRKDLRKSDAADEEVEKLLNSPAVQGPVRRGMAAYIQEQLPDLLLFLVEQAMEKQTWSWKVLLEATGLAEILRAAVLGQPDADTDTIVSSGFERDLLENVRELLLPADTTANKPQDQKKHSH